MDYIITNKKDTVYDETLLNKFEVGNQQSYYRGRDAEKFFRKTTGKFLNFIEQFLDLVQPRGKKIHYEKMKSKVHERRLIHSNKY